MMLLVSPEQWANWDKWFNYTLPGYILILGIIFSTLSQVLSTILSNFILKYRPNREMAPGESS